MPISKRNNNPLSFSVPEEEVVKEEVAVVAEAKQVEKTIKPKEAAKKPAAKQTTQKPKVEKKEKPIEVNIEPMIFNKRLNPLSLEKFEEEKLPTLPDCTKKSFILSFARKDVFSLLKEKMGTSTTDILNEALISLLKEKYKEEYIKLAKGE